MLIDLPVTPEHNIEVYDCTLTQFVAFLTGKVDEGLEMDFYQNDEIAYAYFEEESTIYFYLIVNDKEEKQPKEEPTVKKNTGGVGKSNIFAKGMIVLMLILSTMLPQGAYAAGYFSGSMEEDATNYSGLAKARFTTPTGSVTVPGYLTTVKSKVYTARAFTFEDPNRIKPQPSVNLDSLPSGANEELITALLSYREKFSLQEITSTTGINVTQRQLDEATQLALWIHASSVQVNYQIDVNSISDPAVRSLATEINTWATQQVSGLTEGVTMGNYLFPLYKPALNASQASMNKSGDSVIYGPYTVSGQKSSSFKYGVLGGILLDTSNKELDGVPANQQFYAKFPVTYSGDKIVRLVGKSYEYSLNYGQGRLWLDKSAKDTEVQFTVGSTTGSNGLIQINSKDSITNKPVEGVGVQIVTSSPIATVQTNENGTAEYTAPVGTYTLKFTVPDGYLKPADQQVQVPFAGDIQVVNLGVQWSQAMVNFFTVDAQTLAPTGDSEAFIYDSRGKAVKRIAITKGRVQGVTLPEGDYTIVQYKTSGGYAINVGTKFTATAGKISDVSVTQDPNVLPTTMSVKGAPTTSTWIYTLARDGQVLFKMNGTNKLTLPLPNGNYSIMAQKSDGTVTAGPQSFATVLNGETNVELTQEAGTETVTFNFVDTKQKNPIPNVIVGLFDEKHNLMTYVTADSTGKAVFNNVVKHKIYYVKVLGAPDSVSGYSASGNRFIGYTKNFTLELYPLEEVKKVTSIDSIYRVPNVTYVGPDYVYPN